MNEYTNQTPETTNETTDAFDYFGVEEETTEPTSEEVTETAETETKAESETKIEDFLKIKYNGAEKSLTREEAIELAQKGMNYDKVLGERDNLTGIIDQYAKASNMTREQFIDFLKMNLANYEEGAEVENLRKSYPGASDDI